MNFTKILTIILFFLLSIMIFAHSRVIVPDQYFLKPFIENGKFGFIDTFGNVHIKAQYIETGNFVNGLCPVKKSDGSWIFIDKSNVQIWKDKKFRSAGNFSNGYAKVLPMQSNYWTFIDLDGNICGGEYIAAKDFKNGFCAVSENGNGWNFIDKDFKILFQKSYFHCGNFNDDIVLVFDEGDSCYKYLNNDGKTILSLPGFEYFGASQFIDGLACVNYKGKWGFINKAGEFVINPQFEVAMPFFEGMAAVRYGGKWGYIKQNGDFHIMPFIEDSKDFYAGHVNEYRFLKKLYSGSIDFFGEKKIVNKKDIIPVIIDFDTSIILMRFSQDLSVYSSVVRNSVKYGYMDRAGKKVIKPIFDTAFPFEKDIAKVIDSNEMMYINKKGKIIFKRKYKSE
ncbi:MAG: WG repeat-containing protein [Candidatus Muirbacterium halophilum]|nr:WG repeat-containing protein [Candidatus Muirbacterium halophilum]